jgi:hypothetical protein
VVAIDETVNVNIASDGSGVREARTGYTQAVRDGRAYTAATSALRIPTNEYMNVAFSNPSDSGKNCFFVARKIGSNRAEGSRPLSYGFILSPVAMAGSTSIAAANRKTGEAASSMQVWHMVSSARMDSVPSTVSPSEGFLPNGGGLLNVDEDGNDATRVVPPGGSFGFFISGEGIHGGADKARIVMTWYEEDV